MYVYTCTYICCIFLPLSFVPFLSPLHLSFLCSSLHSWRQGEITNFEYLMELNKLAGRTFNDLMQFPVFPFILADYRSTDLDLRKTDSFRFTVYCLTNYCLFDTSEHQHTVLVMMCVNPAGNFVFLFLSKMRAKQRNTSTHTK